MNNNISSIVVATAATILGVVMFVIGATVTLPTKQPTQPLGSAADNITLTTAQATSVWIGKDVDSTLVGTNTARAYLAIWNLSGATGTPQTLYCNTNGQAAQLYSGLVIHASTTPFVFDLDRLYRGALHCKFPSSSSTVSIIEW